MAFEHVNYRYRHAENLALEDIDFSAKSGETVAIIGGTGSGKTTLVNLLPRFYDVESGKILLNGKNIKETSQHNLREMIGFVPQRLFYLQERFVKICNTAPQMRPMKKFGKL